MHYIRLLRPPQLTRITGALQLDLVLAVTTDLGDTFLTRDVPLQLQVAAFINNDTPSKGLVLVPKQGPLAWRASDRVLKPAFDLPAKVVQAIVSKKVVELYILPADRELAVDSIGGVLDSTGPGGRAQVMPAWVQLSAAKKDMECLRRRMTIHADGKGYVEVEEEIGESIARHIWDAGVISMCAIMASFADPSLPISTHGCMTTMRDILSRGPNILELGCGVGILGNGITQLLSSRGGLPSTIVMTDLEEAEDRAVSNIWLLARRIAREKVKSFYANLDWEDGRVGRFSDAIQSMVWDLVVFSDCTYNVDMLPALVETLSAIHASNCKQQKEKETNTKVFMATKPRHDSERELFGLLDKHGWATKHKQVLRLPVLGADDQTVEMYIFEKTGSI